MSKHRSISQRLNRAKSAKVKEEVALDWASQWQREHDALIKRLERAIIADNYDELCIATGQLKAVAQKRFTALPRVITTLAKSHI